MASLPNELLDMWCPMSFSIERFVTFLAHEWLLFQMNCFDTASQMIFWIEFFYIMNVQMTYQSIELNWNVISNYV